MINDPLLNVAAKLRAQAVSGAKVIGIDGAAEDLDWIDLLYRTERALYLNDCAFWHIQGVRAASDQPRALTITFYPILNPQTGGNFTNPKGEVIPAEEVVVMPSINNPPRAVDRLKSILSLEKSTIDSLQVGSDSVVNPRYILKMPKANAPITPTEGKTKKDEIVKNMDSPLFITYGAEDFSAMPMPVNAEATEKLRETARFISADSGVPSQFLGTVDGSQYSNLLVIMRTYYEDTIRPETRRIVSAVRAQGAFPDFDLDLTDHYSFAQTEMEKADVRFTNVRAWSIALRDNVMSPQEYREAMGLEGPVPQVEIEEDTSTPNIDTPG